MVKPKILLLNGPNLNLLGRRETNFYGTQSFEAFFETLQDDFAEHFDLSYQQSNHEGILLDTIHAFGFQDNAYGLILNAGAFTHTSIALADALRAIPIPTIEVHISNVYQRESFRQHSYLSAAAKGVIGGLGLMSYRLAVQYFVHSLQIT